MFNFFKKGDIGEPPWDYNFLVNLDESEYPKYLAKIFKLRTSEKLPLKFDFKNKNWVIDKKRSKTFNQKLQWIKLYGITDLMRMCTDKVAVRDYVKEKIGEEYLKPVLQILPDIKSSPHPNPLPMGEGINADIQSFKKNINDDRLDGLPLAAGEGWGEGIALANTNNDVSTYFDQIQWDKLPNAFVIKCNHGCKWHFIIKNKEDVLNTKLVVDLLRKNITGWLEQEYFPWNGFEMQYKGIEPKILIEPLMRDEINTEPVKINVYCFNGTPKWFVKFFDNNKMSIWNGKFEPLDNIFNFPEENIKKNIDFYINQTYDLSIKLSKKFEFVRVDWMIYKKRLYFEELTFTPYSGFLQLDNSM